MTQYNEQHTALSIPFNRPAMTGDEQRMVAELYRNPAYFRERHFLSLSRELLQQWYGDSKVLLTNSCTQALELAVQCLRLQKGDEVILPSFTYVSTANAVVNNGGTPVFVDIDPQTLNTDPSLVEQAITDKTKAIIPVHYSGIGCDMDKLKDIAGSGIAIIEDAAHSFLAEYEGKKLGTFGTFGCISFDYTKNISCGQGGMLLINDPAYVESAEIAYEIGTDRARFLRGEKDFFEWAAPGSKYMMPELTAAYLYGQLQHAEDINSQRLAAWQYYYRHLAPLAEQHAFQLPVVAENARHYGHIFQLLTATPDDRTALLRHLASSGIEATFHYIPLHSSSYGQTVGRFIHHEGTDHTTDVSSRLLRLPIFHGITREQQDRVISAVEEFWH